MQFCGTFFGSNSTYRFWKTESQMLYGIIVAVVPVPTPKPKPQPVLICPKCKSYIPVCSKFCPQCGADLRPKEHKQKI
ncbi:MAG: zinc ribbon domain-containing protein [Thermoproteota archaeon]|nr:zinc ribbon domain-containing protein [Thermoproteota archaeon]